ncbi:hypothetical protein cyc_07249 [Cyclospora cayetanensis]|uniref:Uncharacterized protein n=1 Tax=Cyclospora cayetanensis TaxID=88456 RepID=A0A1D3D7K5_9EIME|nr:hypothetical protein cyc_07249 [Cyclospora cayetanensis]
MEAPLAIPNAFASPLLGGLVKREDSLPGGWGPATVTSSTTAGPFLPTATTNPTSAILQGSPHNKGSCIRWNGGVPPALSGDTGGSALQVLEPCRSQQAPPEELLSKANAA